MSTFINPYRAQQPAAEFSDEESTNTSRFKIVIWLLAYLYPVWFTGSFYVTWLIAWIQLGHCPRPMLDDPMLIGGFTSIVYYTSGVVVLAMPALTPLGLVASFFSPIRVDHAGRTALRVTLAALYIGVCAAAVVTLRTDPGRVVEWWFD